MKRGRDSTGMARTLAKACAPVVLSVAFVMSGCSSLTDTVSDAVLGTGTKSGQLGYISGFLGGVVADEPHAALVARDVLSAGGTAADAAVALGFALSVTLPSRAGLGGGGACLVFSPGSGVEAMTFLPVAPAHPRGGDRPAAVPMLARGLFALHAKYGNRTFASLLDPAERMAREGFTASRAFVRDLAVVAGPLAADPAARAIFFPGGRPVQEGAPLLQPGLAATFTQLRQAGVGDLYQGALAHRLVDAAPEAGAGLGIEDLRTSLPSSAPPLTLAAGDEQVAFLPLPADGGLATEAAFQTLQHSPTALTAAGDRALAIAAQFRHSGGDAKALLALATLPAATLPPLAASTTFLTLDRRGDAVACALTMNNLFGTGRVAEGTGILFAASPAWQTPPLLSVAIASSAGRRPEFRAAVGGSGQSGAPLAAAVALSEALADTGRPARPLPTPPPDPGRANVIQCNDHLPGNNDACGWATDPRGAGLALGGTMGGTN
jgi:gamma-glutamyltranspeptidase / glutathione hydrolase